MALYNTVNSLSDSSQTFLSLTAQCPWPWPLWSASSWLTVGLSHC